MVPINLPKPGLLCASGSSSSNHVLLLYFSKIIYLPRLTTIFNS
ncbi:unnamed protein product [Brassica oleracea var. botrytis]